MVFTLPAAAGSSGKEFYPDTDSGEFYVTFLSPVSQMPGYCLNSGQECFFLYSSDFIALYVSTLLSMRY
jgi:hypothetical protein